VPEDKKVHWELIRSELQRIFVVRLREEMKRQGNISDNALAKRCKSLGYKVGQSSVSRIVGGRQDPTLLLVHAPDGDVIDLLERVLASARKGYVKSVAIVAVNPIHQVETGAAGDLTEVRTNVLLGGLTRAANELMKQK
jgi:hypothetical protein